MDTISHNTIATIDKMQQPRKHHLESLTASTKLLDFPNELILLLLENLSVCSGTCFGLTCKAIYGLYKTEYPNRVSLDEIEVLGSGRNQIALGHLLSRWRGLGPHFRLWKPIPRRNWFGAMSMPDWYFLPIGTYGDTPGKQDCALYFRYQDYHVTHLNGDPCLPNPRNRIREEWEAEAIEIIVRDIQQYEVMSKWGEFWCHTTVWKSINWQKIMFEELDRRAGVLIEEIKGSEEDTCTLLGELQLKG